MSKTDHLKDISQVQIGKKYLFRPREKDVTGLSSELKDLINKEVTVSRIDNLDIYISELVDADGEPTDECIYHYELYPAVGDWDT